MAYIYKIVNDVNEKVYVGKTIIGIQERFAEHCKESHKDRFEKRPLYNAMNKYGVSHFSVELVEEVEVEKLNEREIFWIKEYDSFKNGYNATLGGDGTPYLDYNFIFKTWESNHNLNKTAEICGCCVDSVSKIVKEYGGEILPSQGNMKAVAKLDNKTKEILEIYPSITEAERQNGNTRHIAQVCLGKRKTCKGFDWAYLEDLQ